MLWDFLFAWLPTTGIKAAFLALFTIVIIFIVLRIVKLVLDAIPFL